MGLPISVNGTFFARSYGWGSTSDYWFKIGDFAPTGAGWPKISDRRGRLPPTILLPIKLKTEWSFAWYKNLDRFFFRFVTMHAFDRRTDGRTEISSQDRVCIPCSAVKTCFEWRPSWNPIWHLFYHIMTSTIRMLDPQNMGIDTKIMPLSYLGPEIMLKTCLNNGHFEIQDGGQKRKSQPGKLPIMVLEVLMNILIPFASFYPKCLAEPLFWVSAPWL